MDVPTTVSRVKEWCTLRFTHTNSKESYTVQEYYPRDSRSLDSLSVGVPERKGSTSQCVSVKWNKITYLHWVITSDVTSFLFNPR